MHQPRKGRDEIQWLGMVGAMVSKSSSTSFTKPDGAAVNRYFSMASARKLQLMINEKLQQLTKEVWGFKNADGNDININHFFLALSQLVRSDLFLPPLILYSCSQSESIFEKLGVSSY